MSDADALADFCRHTFVGVNHSAVLHVAVVADLDRVAVAVSHCGGPHGHVRAERHAADDDGERMDERAGVDRRQFRSGAGDAEISDVESRWNWLTIVTVKFCD